MGTRKYRKRNKKKRSRKKQGGEKTFTCPKIYIRKNEPNKDMAESCVAESCPNITKETHKIWNASSPENYITHADEDGYHDPDSIVKNTTEFDEDMSISSTASSDTIVCIPTKTLLNKLNDERKKEKEKNKMQSTATGSMATGSTATGSTATGSTASSQEKIPLVEIKDLDEYIRKNFKSRDKFEEPSFTGYLLMKTKTTPWRFPTKQLNDIIQMGSNNFLTDNCKLWKNKVKYLSFLKLLVNKKVDEIFPPLNLKKDDDRELWKGIREEASSFVEMLENKEKKVPSKVKKGQYRVKGTPLSRPMPLAAAVECPPMGKFNGGGKKRRRKRKTKRRRKSRKKRKTKRRRKKR